MGYIKRLFSNGRSVYEWDGIHTPAVNTNASFEATILKEVIVEKETDYSQLQLSREDLITVLSRIADALEEIAY